LTADERRRSLVPVTFPIIASPAPSARKRRQSGVLSPAHALSSACVSAVAAVSVSEKTERRCRFSSIDKIKEYEVDSEEDRRNMSIEEEETIDEESSDDEFFDEEDDSLSRWEFRGRSSWCCF
jgi:hypothetical protein